MENNYEDFSSFSSNRRRGVVKKKENIKDKYGILIRVSTDMQVEDGDSIQMQRERAEEIVKDNNGIVHEVYIEEGVSASKNRIAQRPQLQRLLEDVEAGVINKIIAYKRDRLTRNTGDWLQIMELCAKNQCDIIFSASGEAEMFNDPIYGKVFETILGSISEMESANTSMRVRDTMASLAKSGEWTGGKLPYGYNKNMKDGVYIEESKLPIIKEIEDLYLSGLGIHSIAKWLNGEKISTLGVRAEGKVEKNPQRKGMVSHWTKQAITTILFNPFYVGVIEYSTEGNKLSQKDDSKFIRVKGKHPAIRSEERQKEIYKMRDRKSIAAPRTYSTTFLFSELIHCGYCGCKYQTRNTTKHGNKYSYYTCSSKTNSSKTANGHHCTNKNYKKEILDDFLMSQLKKYLENVSIPELMSRFFKNSDKNKKAGTYAIEEVEKEIEQLKNDEEKIMRLMLDLDTDSPMYNALKGKYEEQYVNILNETAEKKKLKLELQDKLNENEDHELSTKRALEVMGDFSKTIDTATTQMKRRMIYSIIDKVVLYPDGTCDIELVFDLYSKTNKTTSNEGNGSSNDKGSDGSKNSSEKVIINDLMGDPNASIPTPQPVLYRPMFASYGKARAKTSLTFVSKAAYENKVGEKLGLQKLLKPVKNIRQLKKTDMKLNGEMPKIEVDPQTYEVKVDGQMITCEAAEVVPMAQRYFLF